MASEFQLFDGKNLSSLFKDIYDNQQNKKKNISELIESLRKLIKNVGEAIPGKLSTALRLGLNPRVIAGASRFLGIPGLIASTGYTLYDYLSNKDKEAQ